MFETLNYKTLLYLDIETTPIVKLYDDLSEVYKSAWEIYCKRHKLISEPISIDQLNEVWKNQAALIPEFSMIICVSIGEYDKFVFKTWTRFLKNENDNEKLLLIDVQKYIKSKNPKKIIAHNGKEFDYPFIVIRSLCNGITPPPQLQIFNKKPWEVELWDTKEIWKFGGNKNASLISICAALNIPSPKTDIDGSMVYNLFYDEKKYENLKRIAKYCSNDVRALALIVQKLIATDDYNQDKDIEVFPEIKYI